MKIYVVTMSGDGYLGSNHAFTSREAAEEEIKRLVEEAIVEEQEWIKEGYIPRSFGHASHLKEYLRIEELELVNEDNCKS